MIDSRRLPRHALDRATVALHDAMPHAQHNDPGRRARYRARQVVAAFIDALLEDDDAMRRLADHADTGCYSTTPDDARTALAAAVQVPS